MKNSIKTSIAVITAAISCTLANADEFPVTFGGFFSNGYLDSTNYNYLGDTEDGSFEFAEMGINATWSPVSRTTVTGQLFTFELGPYGNYDPIIDYLFVDYNFNQYFGVRAGRVKRPYGIYNEIQDIDVARTSVLLPMGMYDQRFRAFSASVDGLSFYGSVPFGNLQSIDYNVYHGKIYLNKDGGHGAGTQTSVSRLPYLQDPKITRLTSETSTGGQLWWNTPLSGLRIGAAHDIYKNINFDLEANFLTPIGALPYTSDTDLDVDTSKISVEYYLNDWTFTSEYEIWDAVLTTQGVVAGSPQPLRVSETKAETYYISASKRFLEKFQGGITYAVWYDDDTLKHDPTEYSKDWQFSLRYDATSYWTLKAEYHDISGTNRIFNQNGQNPVIDTQNWSLVALKSTFTF